MNKTNKIVGVGIALIAGSVLAVTPVAAAASREHPAWVCVDNASALQCESLVRPAAHPGGSGHEVAVRPSPTVRIDAKDHPNYGLNTPESPGDGDAQDHPDYGASSTPGDGGDGVVIRNHPTNPPL